MKPEKKTANKTKQEYEGKPDFPTCSNCVAFKFDYEYVGSALSNKMARKETKLRCGVGGFAVRREGTCILHKPSSHPGN